MRMTSRVVVPIGKSTLDIDTSVHAEDYWDLQGLTGAPAHGRVDRARYGILGISRPVTSAVTRRARVVDTHRYQRCSSCHHAPPCFTDEHVNSDYSGSNIYHRHTAHFRAHTNRNRCSRNANTSPLSQHNPHSYFDPVSGTSTNAIAITNTDYNLHPHTGTDSQTNSYA